MSQAKRRVQKSPTKKAASSRTKDAKMPVSRKAAKALAPKKASAKAAPAKAKGAKKAKPAPSKPAASSLAPAARPGPRADLGAPIDGFFEKQPAHLRPILEELRALVADVVRDATSSIKWGMPFYVIGRETVCALAGFKSHVNLILSGPPSAFDDPAGRLEGEAKIGRHLKLRTLDELPRDSVRGWLATAARLAREGGKA